MKYEIDVAPAIDHSGISALELSDFLQKFRAAYVVATWFVDYEVRSEWKRGNFGDDGLMQHYLHDRLEALKGRFELFVRTQRALPTIAKLSKHRLAPSEELVFSEVSTNSPLKFIGYCTGTALVALALAVALAGGEADLMNMRFTVQPMADAIVKVMSELRR